MKKTILLVEDDFVVLGVTKIYLENQSYQVITATDGLEGLLYWLSNRQTVDLVISDYNMPEIDGLTMLKAMLIINPNSKMILLTASNEIPALSIVPEITVLKKPIEAEQLIFQIERKFAHQRPINKEDF